MTNPCICHQIRSGQFGAQPRKKARLMRFRNAEAESFSTRSIMFASICDRCFWGLTGDIPQINSWSLYLSVVSTKTAASGGSKQREIHLSDPT